MKKYDYRFTLPILLTFTGIVAPKWATGAYASLGSDQRRIEGIDHVEASAEQELSRLCQLWPSNGKSEIDRNRNGECGEAIPQVSDEGMLTRNDVGGGLCWLPASSVAVFLSSARIDIDRVATRLISPVAPAPSSAMAKKL